MGQDLIDKLISTKLTGKNGYVPPSKNYIDAGWADKPTMQQYVKIIFVEGKSAAQYAECIRTYTLDGNNIYILVFLGGKIRNTIKADDIAQLPHNEMFMDLIRVMGLTWGMDYRIAANIKTLRAQAGGILMMDADTDGLHIKMLTLAFFHKYFPSLLEIGFFSDWRTPIISFMRNKQRIAFYTQKEFDDYVAAGNKVDLATAKHHKGLGTSSPKDAKLDSENPYTIRFWWDTQAAAFVQMSMSDGKNITKFRKQWIQMNKLSQPQIYQGYQTVTSFINDEFIHFCLETLTRHLPSNDGLNESRRMVVYTASKQWKGFRGKGTERLDVFGALVTTMTSYAHGSPCTVIMGQTQTFVGHSNLPMFEADGMFGTRLEGGKDCSQTRYPLLKPLKPIHGVLDLIFPERDNPLLEHVWAEGKEKQYKMYYPTFPLHLINGWDSIAIGWSSYIPCHHPGAILNWLIRRLQGVEYKDLPELVPWYDGFKGTNEIVDTREFGLKEIRLVDWDNFKIDDLNDTRVDITDLKFKGKYVFVSTGCWEYTETGIRITELPVGVWTKPYFELLEKWKNENYIDDYDKTACDIYTVDITITDSVPKKPGEYGLIRARGMTNMNILNDENRPVKYHSAKEIIEQFYRWQLPHYTLSYTNLLRVITEKLADLKDLIDINHAVLAGQISTHTGTRRRLRKDVEADVARLGLNVKAYHNLRLSGIDEEGYQELITKYNKYYNEYLVIKAKEPAHMWIEDLLKLTPELEAYFQSTEAERRDHRNRPKSDVVVPKKRARRRKVATE
jgi:DNA topoisomerase-2